jgi:tripartite-type tricarboxylate transporter receptor subunit TctC
MMKVQNNAEVISFLVLVAVIAFFQPSTIHAQTDPFYSGKTIRIIVGTTPGGFYDRWGRLLSRYLPKFIPGNPEIIVQNMPGAGSMIAMNHVYNVAKPDGLTLGMPIFGIYLDQLVGRKEVQFDILKIHYIGSPEKSDVLFYVRADSPFKSVLDMRKAAEPPKCGSTGTASTDYVLARLLDDTLGIKINTITGYAGGSEIDIAVEKGEVICRGMTIAPHFGREPFDTWHKKGFDRHLLVSGEKRDPRAGDVPTIYEIFDKENTPAESRRVADVVLRGGDFGRPMFAPPGTPAERVKILREAYVKSMNDPGLLAEAKKGRMDVEPVTGEDLQALARRIMNQPLGVLERVKKILQ